MPALSASQGVSLSAVPFYRPCWRPTTPGTGVGLGDAGLWRTAGGGRAREKKKGGRRGSIRYIHQALGKKDGAVQGLVDFEPQACGLGWTFKVTGRRGISESRQEYGEISERCVVGPCLGTKPILTAAIRGLLIIDSSIFGADLQWWLFVPSFLALLLAKWPKPGRRAYLPARLEP